MSAGYVNVMTMHMAYVSANKQTNVSNLFDHFSVWVCLSALCLYKTNFFKQLWENPEVNQFFLNITLIATGFQIVVYAYLTIYGPLVLKK